METNKNYEKEKAIKEYYNEYKKSYFGGIMMVLFFGPIGLFYTNWIAGLFLTILFIGLIGVMGASGFLVAVMFVYPISILLNLSFVSSHNKKLMSKIKLNNALSI